MHKMKLQNLPFIAIKEGRKTIELRLYDEKRQQIHSGQLIEFTNIETNETLKVKVIDLHIFDSFQQLYESMDLTLCGYTKEQSSTASYQDMNAYYSLEQQTNYQVVGIELEVLPELNDATVRRIIQKGRIFMKHEDDDPYPEYYSDQELKKPQPPLYKAAMSDVIIPLPKNYRDLNLNHDILEVLYHRRSSRVYTQEAMSLLELSYLLWATQGVKEIRGNNYATLRTVACGGARHEFECYMAIKNVEGLACGYYHYMPDLHALALLQECNEEAMNEMLHQSLCGQDWSFKANVTFFYSAIPYRAEWRYGIYSHRVQLMDVGHITQNLYVAAESANLGTCAIAAVDVNYASKVFGLDGEEEFILYSAPAGKVSKQNKAAEDAFYAFLKEE